ncbi:membrane protein insertion efficiency factor YidD [Sinobacterium norvegicum]|uniref:membrane protein insertion efficiency factor YidD n=1 Tax=Sinobacterium norvegicum TaxID=1641715 RepID=UPI001F34B833|nr:membrane protein insertion efficiency factor YidD [Sinobacterium norvegicum]
MKKIALLFIKFYQYVISPIIGPRCRFYPTCSEYAQQAIEDYGAVKGSFLAIKRILRCHPFHEGGCDPVPPVQCSPSEDSCSKETSSPTHSSTNHD